MSFKEELEKTLHQYMQKHGNTISQWKNNDYEYAQTLPEDEQDEIVPELLTSIINLVDKEVEAARKEEWAKIHTKYQKGTVKGQYTILEAVRRVGKNTKFRVECLNCHGVMFRYANKFNLPHKNCVNNEQRNKLRGE